MKLEELLKDNPEALQAVNDAIAKANAEIKDNNKKIRYTDLGEGGYVAVKKYTDLETKYNDLVNTPNEFEKKYNDLVTQKNTDLTTEREKLSLVVKKLAVDNAIEQLGIKDNLTKAGIKSLIQLDTIELNEDYSIKEGLSNQIDSIKETYKDSFNTTIVSTGDTTPKTNPTNKKVYNSRAEIEALSQEQVLADLDNITAQLENLK